MMPRLPALPVRGNLRPTAPLGALPPLRSVRVLDQLRERLRLMHYSLRTEEVYAYWLKAFIRFHGVRHPAEMGGPEVEAFLMHLANERGVSPSTHSQALSALLFFYTKVLGQDLPWLKEVEHPRRRQRLPVVLTVDAVSRVLKGLSGEHLLLAQLLYGTGLRIHEATQLRVKDVDFGQRALIVREGKAGKQPPVAPLHRPTAQQAPQCV